MASTILLPYDFAIKNLTPAKVESKRPSGWVSNLIPNFSDWREGDIILVHRSADTVGLVMSVAQNLSSSIVTRSGASCSHAAIYVGNGMVVDATPNLGVSKQSVLNYVDKRAIQVRRLSSKRIAPNLIRDIAITASSHIGKPFSILQIIFSQLFRGAPTNPDELYCSALVELAVSQATGINLMGLPEYQPLYPATLAAHPDLEDVPLEWCF